MSCRHRGSRGHTRQTRQTIQKRSAGSRTVRVEDTSGGVYEATYHRALLDQDAGFCSCRPHLPNSTPQHQQARLRGRDEESEVGKSRRQLHLRSVQRIATHKITEQLRTSSYRLYAPTSRAEAAAPGGRTPATASYRLYLKAGGAAQCSDLDRGLRASKRARASKDVQHPRWRWLAAARARGKGAMTGGSLASCGRLARQRRCRQAAPANIQYYQVVLNSWLSNLYIR